MCTARCRVQSAERLEVRLSGDEKVSAVGMGFALHSLTTQLPHVIVAGIPTVERAVVTRDDKTGRCAPPPPRLMARPPPLKVSRFMPG